MASLMNMVIKCVKCNQSEGSAAKWIGCSCGKWYHRKCVYLDDLTEKNIKKLQWSCEICVNKGCDALEKVIELQEELKVALEKIESLEMQVTGCRAEIAEKEKMGDGINQQELMGKIDDMSLKLDVLQQSVKDVNYNENKKTYAERVKKNLLVIKTPNGRISDRKDEVAKVLESVQIADTKFPKSGDLVVNFNDEAERDRADVLIRENFVEIETKKQMKVHPKFMICNVNAEEVDDIIDTLISRNRWLGSIEGIENKLTFLFDKPANGGTKHFIIKCHPEVRKAIHENDDKVRLSWGSYRIRDRYHVKTCYHCQRYGHIAEKCKFKDDDIICGKCSENHETKSCNSVRSQKCINCVRQKRHETAHRVNDRCCKAFDAEISKMAANTDHGF